jgi:transcriptional regulator with XRE-family HTH domain
MHDDVPPALTMGERVRARRLELGINQAECAKAIGITRAGLSQLEENKTHSLNSDAFARLLVLLKADHVYLVWGRKTPPPVAPKRRK